MLMVRATSSFFVYLMSSESYLLWPTVLTKVFVYSGIAILACSFVPVLFEVIGWGVKSW